MMGVVKLLVASIHELASCDASSQLTVLDGIWLKRPGSVIAVPLEIRRSIFLTNIVASNLPPLVCQLLMI